MTPLEWLLTFLLSLEGSLRANVVAESRLLDIFVGWPNTRRLAFRLEELYR